MPDTTTIVALAALAGIGYVLLQGTNKSHAVIHDGPVVQPRPVQTAINFDPAPRPQNPEHIIHPIKLNITSHHLSLPTVQPQGGTRFIVHGGLFGPSSVRFLPDGRFNGGF